MSAQPFERYPALASWIERLGNTPGVLPLGDWMVFVGALNNALTRAEGPAPVSAPLDREGVVVEIRTQLYSLCETIEDEAYAKLSDEADPHSQGFWRGQKSTSKTIRRAMGEVFRALSQQDQVGLTTPAVLGEPSADALRSEGDDAVGAAERDVGRYIYQRIETLMDAKHVTGIANELTYLATIAEAVEEYGSEACGGEDLSVFQGPPPPAGGVK